MTISFTCPHCQSTTQVDDAYAGQSGPCAKCGQTVTVPGTTLRATSGSAGTKTITIVVAACLLAFLVCGGGAAALLIPAIGEARKAAERANCTNQLKQIALAMHNYHDIHGTLPPAYIPDANGQPMTSWRVLILPYLEQSAVHSAYDFDEPWNSPNNLAVTSMTMPGYQCPSDPTASCSYFVIDVPGGLFDGSKASSFSTVTDGLSNTIMVVEVTGMNVHWSEPRDLGPATLNMGINANRNGTSISSNHQVGAVVALGDGSVRVLDNATAVSTLQLLITKGDNQVVPAF